MVLLVAYVTYISGICLSYLRFRYSTEHVFPEHDLTFAIEIFVAYVSSCDLRDIRLSVVAYLTYVQGCDLDDIRLSVVTYLTYVCSCDLRDIRLSVVTYVTYVYQLWPS
jgi:hypothetical protein